MNDNRCICNSCKYLLSCDFEPEENQCELFKNANDSDDLNDTIEGEFYE